jgi:tetratricopeptide (TPR) repeat protein
MRARNDKRVARVPAVVTALAAGLVSASSFASAETGETQALRALNQSLIGSYLSGRFARSLNDTELAAQFYNSALMFDPASEMLLEQALLMETTRGSWSEALRLADELSSQQPQHRMAQLVLGLADFKAKDWKKAEEHFKSASSGPIGELTSALVLAWVKLAENNTNAALDLLVVPKQAEWAQFYLRYHRALIADAAGRKGEAKTAFDKVFKQDSRTLRTALAYARSAANAGDSKTARTVLKEHLDKSQGEGHPLARDLQQQIQSGAKVPLLVSTPQDGLTEVFYGLGEALIGEGAVGVGILYLQMALYVTPEHPFALAALANAYESNKQYAEAIDIYDRIPKASPLEPAIEIRKAFNLNSLERADDARAVLTKLLDGEQAKAAEPS